jgi:hypothetical protein
MHTNFNSATNGINTSAIQLKDSVLFTNNVVEMSIYDNKLPPDHGDSLDFGDNKIYTLDKKTSEATIKC